MAGASGDVVEHHRHVGALDDGAEVVEHARLAGLVVVGGDEQQPVGAELLGLPGQLDGVCGGVGADAGDHDGSLADRVDDRAQDVAVLGHGGGRALTGGPADHHAVVAVGDEVVGDAGRAVEVDGSVVVERRRHRRQHPAEARAGGRGRHDPQAIGLPTSRWLRCEEQTALVLRCELASLDGTNLETTVHRARGVSRLGRGRPHPQPAIKAKCGLISSATRWRWSRSWRSRVWR